MPAKMKLINTVTTEEMAALYNPDQLKNTVKATYRDAPRLSGLPAVRYVRTEREEFSMTLYFDDRFEDEGVDMMEWSRFLHSLMYPVELPNGELTDPPEVLFIWSNLFVHICKVLSVDFSFTQFREDLAAEIYTADVKLKECGPFAIVTSSDKRFGMDFILTSTLAGGA